MKTIQEIIKRYILEDIFQNGYPQSIKGQDTFDFILNYEVDDMFLAVSEIEELVNLGFEVTDINMLDSIRDIKNLMESKYHDLITLQKDILFNCTQSLQINRFDEMSDEDFNYLRNREDSVISRDGTVDEFITFKTINLGDLL
jgi:hypothetical protein